jgi:hypothetical protein
MAEVIFLDEAQDDLINKGLEYKLDSNQRQEIRNLIKKLEKNPSAGKKKNLPLMTDFAIEKHIGKQIFCCFYYDVTQRLSVTTVRIKRVSIAYKY